MASGDYARRPVGFGGRELVNASHSPLSAKPTADRGSTGFDGKRKLFLIKEFGFDGRDEQTPGGQIHIPAIKTSFSQLRRASLSCVPQISARLYGVARRKKAIDRCVNR